MAKVLEMLKVLKMLNFPGIREERKRCRSAALL